MVTPSLLDFIKQCKSKKINDETIKSTLLSQGWSEADITMALQAPDMPIPPLPPKPEKDAKYTTENSASFDSDMKPSNMWDTFEHVLLFISMYALSLSFSLLLHFFADKISPGINPSRFDYMISYQSTMVKGYLASIIVSYPLFSLIFLNITSRTKSNPLLRNLHSRKLLIYLTLIITFIFMIFNITSIVYNLLNGNVTLNFLLHFLITVGVCGLIFGYYFFEIKEDRKIHA